MGWIRRSVKWQAGSSAGAGVRTGLSFQFPMSDGPVLLLLLL